jgi:hypothetical protein
MPRIPPPEVGRLGAVAAISLGVATLAIAILEAAVGVPDASSVYIVAVVATAFLAGTVGAVVAQSSGATTLAPGR